jgi:hypothetical protein
MTANAGRLFVDVPPRCDSFLTKRQIAGKDRFVFWLWHYGSGIGGGGGIDMLLRADRYWRQCSSTVQQCCKSELHGDPRFLGAQSVHEANGVRKEARTQFTGSKRDYVRGGRSSRSGKNSEGAMNSRFADKNDGPITANNAIEGAPVDT